MAYEAADEAAELCMAEGVFVEICSGVVTCMGIIKIDRSCGQEGMQN